MKTELIDYAIGKLTELKIKAEFEDRARKKVRYVKKVQAYQDLIDLLKEIEKWNCGLEVKMKEHY